MTATVDAALVVEVHRTSTPARDLPLALVHDVVQVLRAHGLDPDLLDLSTALYEVIVSTPVDRGGSRSAPAVEAADVTGGLSR